MHQQLGLQKKKLENKEKYKLQHILLLNF